MKKILIFLIIILLFTGGFFTYKKLSSKNKQEEKTKIITKKKPQINLLTLEKRPYITIVPREDGRELFITIDSLKNKEEKIEYELEYQAGTILQGAGGRIDLIEEPAPVTKKLLLGSCSKGKCKYDENVSGGSLTLYFEGKEDYGLKTDFTLNEMDDSEGLFLSKDNKISLDIGEIGLTNDSYVIAASTMGLPGKVKGEILSGPIGFFTSSKQSFKKATLTFEDISEKENLKVLGWNNNEWKEYEVEVKNDSISAEVDQLGTFVLISE